MESSRLSEEPRRSSGNPLVSDMIRRSRKGFLREFVMPTLLFALFCGINICALFFYQFLPECRLSGPPGSSVEPVSGGYFRSGEFTRHAGLKSLSDRLLVDPVVPERTESWTIIGFDYRGFILDFKFTKTNIHIKVAAVNNEAASLVLYLEPSQGRRTAVHDKISIKRSKVALIVLPKKRNHWSQNPYLFESTSLPDQRHMPEIGNGHVATVVNGPDVHMNGLYNGNGTTSSRARIPSLVGFRVTTNHSTSPIATYVLNVQEGIFAQTRLYSNPKLNIEREVFAHRGADRLLVARVAVKRLTNADDGGAAVEVFLTNLPDLSQLVSGDIVFSPTETGQSASGKRYMFANGATKIPEVKGQNPSKVTVAWTDTLANFTLAEGTSKAEVIIFVAIASSDVDAIKALSIAMDQDYADIRKSHTDKWLSYWDNGRIDVDPTENFELAQAIYGSFYYLLSSLPNVQDNGNRFIGVSPGGLAHGAINQDYSGHIFWDGETWMFPPILNFFPLQARVMIEARSATLEAAIENAKLYGFAGAKFAWESAFTGVETSPWPPAGQYELHVTSDIALAVRQLIYVTDDKSGLIRELKLDALSVEIARFWQSRVACDVNVCNINGVMPPDEYHYPVNNSMFTNNIVKLALQLPAYMFKFTNGSDPDLPKWAKTAEILNVNSQGVSGEKVFHLEFDGFVPGVWNPASNRKDGDNHPMIKQGDVILMGYPLDIEMPIELRKNDLDIYRVITDPDGPAMTWGMFAVGYLELGNNKVDADTLFEKNFENIVQPFGVWSEIIGGGGALNFLTGMGGFLQAVVNGYGGIRIHEDNIFMNPQPLPKTTHWSVIGYKHVGYQINFVFDFSKDTMSFTTVNKNSTTHLVVVVGSGAIYDLTKLGNTITVPRENATIRAAAASDYVFMGGTADLQNSSGPKMCTRARMLLMVIVISIFLRFPY